MALSFSREFTVNGLRELQQVLNTLPVNVERNILRGALRAGAQIPLQAAKATITSRSGELAASLRVTVRTRRGVVVASVVAGVGITDPEEKNKPIWVEYGTRPHLIKVREGDRPINPRLSAKTGSIVRVSVSTINRSLRIGGKFIGPAVQHPGAARKPFLRPALDANAELVVRAVAAYIKARLTKAGLQQG